MYGGGGHFDNAGGGAANANALFGGGGFMPSQATATPESSGFPKARSAQTLLPLTVKQIMGAGQTSDDKSNFAINGVEVSTVRLVGRMVNKVELVTEVNFILDDGTGRIDVKRWENESSDTKEMADVNDGNYVIVNGTLKGFQGKRQVTAYSVRRVTDFNDVTHHFLHCIHVHLQLTRPKMQPHVQMQHHVQLQSRVNANIGRPSTANQFPPAINQPPVSGHTVGNNPSSLVLSVLTDPAIMHLEHGVSVEYMKNRLNLPEHVIRSAIKHHEDQGIIYNTIDDNHYKSITNG